MQWSDHIFNSLQSGQATVISAMLTFATALIGLATAVGAVEIGRALRAKQRTHWLLMNEALSDNELRQLIERAAKGTLPEFETEHACKLIESKLARLDETDRKFIHQGLTQTNRVGAQRYCHEMLTGA